MHILLIPSWYPSPDQPLRGNFFQEQARLFRDAGHRVGVLAALPYRRQQWRQFFSLPRGRQRQDDQGMAVYYDFFWPLRPRTARQKVGWYRRHLARLVKDYFSREGRPDVVHVHSLVFGGIAAAAIPELREIPLVLTEHSSLFLRDMLPSSLEQPIQSSLGAYKRLLTVSSHLSRVMEERFPGFDWGVMPNPLSPPFSNPSPIQTNSANFSGEKGCHRYTFLNVGMADPNKGQDILIQAFAREFRGDSRYRLVIIGGGPFLAGLKEAVLEQGVENQVELRGSCSRQEVFQAMGEADCFVLASLHETFGIALIEAQACGLPVVATRSGGPDSLVSPETGILVEPGSVQALAQGMREILDLLRLRSRREIQEQALACYGPQSVLHKHITMYQGVKS